jgi:two-component sensor histidine kinase
VHRVCDSEGALRSGAVGHVLVVDDDRVLREELAAGLAAYGFTVRSAADADAALAVLAVGPDIAVVLTDIRMPGRSGIALAEQLLATESPFHAVEVILLSGHAGIEDAQRAVRAGAFDFMRKPVRLLALAEVVERAMARALERRRTARAMEQQRLEREALYAAAPVGLGRIGRDLRVTGSNAALRDLLGLGEGDQIGQLWAAAPSIRAELEPALQRILAGGRGAPPERHRLEVVRADRPRGDWPPVLEVWLYPVPEAGATDRVAAVGLACLDVTAEAALVRELDHRVKNAFAVVLGLVQGAVRCATGHDAASLARDLTGRVVALSRANDLVRPAVTGAPSVAPATTTTLTALVGAVIAPFVGGATVPRISVSGPLVAVGPQAAPGLALVLHEWTTNAVKYGALSKAEGSVTLGWRVDGETLTMDWREMGGPPVTGAPIRSGFGARMMRQADFGGSGQRVALDWSDPAGLRARLTVLVNRLGK